MTPRKMTALRPRILVIDDEPQIHRFLGPALDAAGYEAERADTAAEGLRAIASRPPDAVVLEPGFARHGRQDGAGKGAGLLRGPDPDPLRPRSGDREDREALDLGADDYVEKPFGVGELLARLRVALRHKLVKAGGEPKVTAGALEVDLILRLVTLDGEPVRLSPKEYELLVRLGRRGAAGC